MKKTIIRIATLIMTMLLLVGCGDPAKALTGSTWVKEEKTDKVSIFPTSVPNTCINFYEQASIQFIKDGSVIVEGGEGDEKMQSNLCTYKIVDSKLVFIAPLGSKSFNEFEIDGKRLTITDNSGNQVVFIKQSKD